MSYINRKQTEDAIRKYADQKHSNGEQIEYINGVLKAISVINEQPAADVEEVKHGEWKVEFHNGKKFITCSVCGSVIDCYTTYIDENEYDGCPYCRAIMDGGKK